MMTWNWPAWVKVPLADLIFSMRGTSALAGIVQHKAHPGDAVRYRSDVFFAADCREQFFGVLYVFTHETSSFN